MNSEFVIKVCDAIMGSGKSSAAITFMNEHPDFKYIYVSPYLSETARIKKACPKLNFVEPNDGYKHIHTYNLIKKGSNIAISHNILKDLPLDILDTIQEMEYILIIDESLDVFTQVDEVYEDIESLINYAKLIQVENAFTDSSLDDIKTVLYYAKKVKKPLSRYEAFFKRLESNDIVKFTAEKGKACYNWLLTLDFLTSFREVYILTYLFEGSLMCTNLRVNGLSYEKIGVSIKDGVYRFGNFNEYIPGYVKTIREKIHIIDNEKLNEIGNNKNAFSKQWIDSLNDEDLAIVKNNLINYFKHIAKCPIDERMWGSFAGKKLNDKDKGELRKKLSDKGYSKSFVVFNKRATNEYKDSKVLAYTANVYMHPGQKQTLMRRGIEPMEQTYALSTLVQWIWRSAIRDGEEITIYIPSYRMRTLLNRWLDIISTNGDISLLEEPIPRMFGYK